MAAAVAKEAAAAPKKAAVAVAAVAVAVAAKAAAVEDARDKQTANGGRSYEKKNKQKVL